MSVLRFDRGFLGKAKPLPGGGCSVPARIARTGVQVYQDASGAMVREYRPQNEVFSHAALASLVGAPVTRGHNGVVNPSNWSKLAKGMVLDVAGTPEKADGADWVSANLAITTADVLDAVNSGELCEISCGYTCDTVDQPGVTPNGEPYDRLQTNIRANHVALLPDGKARAGRNARLKLDGDTMKIRFDGQEYDTASEADMSALQRRIEESKAKADALEARAKTLETDLGKATGRADSVEAELAKTKATLSAEVQAEIKFRADMAPVLGAEYSFDGKSRKQVKLDAIAKIAPKHTLTIDSSDELIDGYWQGLTAKGVEHFTVKTDETDRQSERNDAKTYQKKLQGFQGYDK